ncbi:MAG: alpha-galactosidase [Oscillospiraceae bacterium]|nr:alpha-galactosidase [Oscillospiraceae bacterium]MBQ7130257.1 alpha-galactosidase [Oscillospiraceae bacterium]
MITEQNGVFHIQTEAYSYLFKIDAWGIPEHIHFGAPVKTEDAEALCCRPGLGWGSNVLLQEGDLTSCMDALALEWSGSGRGDYRESPVELSGQPTDFRFEAYRILEGSVAMACSLPQAKDALQTLEITLAQKNAKLTLYYTAFPTALVRRTVLENTADAPIRLNKLMSFTLDLPGSFTMSTFNGGWIAEMRREDIPVGAGKVVNESLTGASSNRHNPGFLLFEPDATENQGRVYGFNLVYSGNHYASAQQSLQGLTRVMQGINMSNFSRELAPGALFETPEAVLCYSGDGFGGLSLHMHGFVNTHIVPKFWQGRPRPVLYNSWEGCVFDFNQHRLLDLADRARDLGCELFVLDDGWFGARNNDRAGLGDYTVNKKKLPEGMEGLARRIRAKGLEFGLWFEPESVNPDSDLYRAHPDWALTDEFVPVYGRNQLLLDLTRKEVRDYIVENVSKILDSAQISYVKWDMNRHSIALGAKAHDFVLGLYDVLRRIFEPRPQILLESCSSGGNRFDLGMLCFSPQVWASDDTDPIERLTIQQGYSYLYPQSAMGAHVSAAPHAQTLRHTPLATRGNVAFFGCLGYELDLKHLLSVEVKEIKAQIAFYKQYRHIFQYGRFTRTKLGWQVSDGATAIAGVFHRLVHAAPAYEQLRLTGLDQNKTYRVTSLAQTIRVGQFGGLLKHVAPVNIDPNGQLLRLADRHVTLPDGGEELRVSGAALMSGILLKPLFRGTGYDQSQRNQGDFGSDIYIIEEA